MGFQRRVIYEQNVYKIISINIINTPHYEEKRTYHC